MKKLLATLIFVTLFVASVLSANGKINKSHLAMKGKDDAKINCVYCHQTAKISKKKGHYTGQYDNSPFCSGKGCHPLPSQ